MFENIGWIVEGKLREGKKEEFRTLMEEIVAETSKEEGTLNYQYYLSDNGDVMVYERFADAQAAHTHIDTWNRFVDRWVAAAEPTRMMHLGELPQDLRDRHAELSPLWLRPFGGFQR